MGTRLVLLLDLAALRGDPGGGDDNAHDLHRMVTTCACRLLTHYVCEGERVEWGYKFFDSRGSPSSCEERVAKAVEECRAADAGAARDEHPFKKLQPADQAHFRRFCQLLGVLTGAEALPAGCPPRNPFERAVLDCVGTFRLDADQISLGSPPDGAPPCLVVLFAKLSGEGVAAAAEEATRAAAASLHQQLGAPSGRAGAHLCCVDLRPTPEAGWDGSGEPGGSASGLEAWDLARVGPSPAALREALARAGVELPSEGDAGGENRQAGGRGVLCMEDDGHGASWVQGGRPPALPACCVEAAGPPLARGSRVVVVGAIPQGQCRGGGGGQWAVRAGAGGGGAGRLSALLQQLASDGHVGVVRIEQPGGSEDVRSSLALLAPFTSCCGLLTEADMSPEEVARGAGAVLQSLRESVAAVSAALAAAPAGPAASPAGGAAAGCCGAAVAGAAREAVRKATRRQLRRLEKDRMRSSTPDASTTPRGWSGGALTPRRGLAGTPGASDATGDTLGWGDAGDTGARLLAAERRGVPPGGVDHAVSRKPRAGTAAGAAAAGGGAQKSRAARIQKAMGSISEEAQSRKRKGEEGAGGAKSGLRRTSSGVDAPSWAQLSAVVPAHAPVADAPPAPAAGGAGAAVLAALLGGAGCGGMSSSRPSSPRAGESPGPGGAWGQWGGVPETPEDVLRATEEEITAHLAAGAAGAAGAPDQEGVLVAMGAGGGGGGGGVVEAAVAAASQIVRTACARLQRCSASASSTPAPSPGGDAAASPGAEGMALALVPGAAPLPEGGAVGLLRARMLLDPKALAAKHKEGGEAKLREYLLQILLRLEIAATAAAAAPPSGGPEPLDKKETKVLKALISGVQFVLPCGPGGGSGLRALCEGVLQPRYGQALPRALGRLLRSLGLGEIVDDDPSPPPAGAGQAGSGAGAGAGAAAGAGAGAGAGAVALAAGAAAAAGAGAEAAAAAGAAGGRLTVAVPPPMFESGRAPPTDQSRCSRGGGSAGALAAAAAPDRGFSRPSKAGARQVTVKLRRPGGMAGKKRGEPRAGRGAAGAAPGSAPPGRWPGAGASDIVLATPMPPSQHFVHETPAARRIGLGGALGTVIAETPGTVIAETPLYAQPLPGGRRDAVSPVAFPNPAAVEGFGESPGRPAPSLAAAAAAVGRPSGVAMPPPPAPRMPRKLFSLGALGTDEPAGAGAAPAGHMGGGAGRWAPADGAENVSPFSTPSPSPSKARAGKREGPSRAPPPSRGEEPARPLRRRRNV